MPHPGDGGYDEDDFHDDSSHSFETDSDDGGADDADPVARALRSGEWVRHTDPNTNKAYYSHATTRRTVWDLAKELGVTPAATAATPADGPGLSLNLGAGFGSPDDRSSDSQRSTPGVALQLPDMPRMGGGGDMVLGLRSGSLGATSGGTDDVDATEAALNIARRGGRVPSDLFAAGGGTSNELLLQVSGYQAFHSVSKAGSLSSGSPGGSFAGEEATAAATRATAEYEERVREREAEAKAEAEAEAKAVAEKDAAKAEAEREAAQAKAEESRRRAVFDTDSSDFSTASQNVAKARVVAAAEAAKALKELPQRPAVAGPPSGPTTAEPSPKAQRSLPPMSSALRPAVSPATATPVPSAEESKRSGGWGDVGPSVPRTGGWGAGLVSPAAAPIPAPAAQTTLPPEASPSSGPGLSPAPVPLQAPLQAAAQPPSELLASANALEHLVRAYTHLKAPGVPSQAGPSQGPSQQQLIADAVRDALGPTPTDRADAGPTHPSGPRAHIARMVHRHQQQGRPGHVDAAAGAGEDKLEGVILDTVLSLLLDAAPQQRVPARSARDPPGTALPRPQGATDHPAVVDAVVPVIPASAPVGAFPDGTVEDLVATALAKYVVAPVKRSLRRGHDGDAAADPPQLRVARLVLTDLGVAVGRILRGAAGGSGPITAVLQYKGPAGETTLRGVAARAVHCLPFEVVADTEDGRLQFRLEYWVTAPRLWEAHDAVMGALRDLELAAADLYAAFESPSGAPRPAPPPRVALPEQQLFSVAACAVAEPAPTPAGPVGPVATSAERVPPSAKALAGRVFSDADAAERLVVAAAMVCDAVEDALPREEEPAVRKAGAPRAVRPVVEDSVAATLEEFLADDELRPMVVRRSVAKVQERRQADPSAALLRETQERVDRMVDRVRYELSL